MESQFQGLSTISGALVTGQTRFQPALLVEMSKSNDEAESEIIDQIWPAVELANCSMPGHGRVVRSMILLAKAGKPFVRAGKGTVVRRLTENAYADEIDALYCGKHQRYPAKSSSLVPTAFSQEAIDSLIRSILPPKLASTPPRDTDDLYISGLDSLTTFEALDALRSAILPHRSHPEISWLSADIFYSHPSIQQLSQLLLAFLNHGVVPERENSNAKMSKTFDHFAKLLKHSPLPQDLDPSPHGLSVVLTGTTGTLGAHLLEELATNPEISSIFCLNRSLLAEQHWHDRCVQRNISGHPERAMVEFFTVNFGIEDFGLDYSTQPKFTMSCDLIIHAAWKVDFNQDLSSFADNIKSVLTLANWSISSTTRPRIAFFFLRSALLARGTQHIIMAKEYQKHLSRTGRPR